MLINCHLSNALSLWEKYKNNLSEDIKNQMENNSQNIPLNINEVYNKCLIQIEDIILSLGGEQLEKYGLPQPLRENNANFHREYFIETNYDIESLERNVINKEKTLTNEQRNIYNQIIHSAENNSGQVFFLDAPGGTGKTFLINLLLQNIRSHNNIALAVASSGIAATLLDGGKTAHATFKLPFDFMHHETPVCKISKQSHLAQILRECQLIVWDESTMMHKNGFDALNRSLQDIRSNDCLMGGLTILLAGDFRQTLPVVPRGTRADEVKACLKSSYLWQLTKKLSLKQNMRVHLMGDESAKEFSKILLQIGDGNYNEVQGKIIIPSKLGIVVKTLDELISQIYPDIRNIKNKSNDWFCERAILTPKNENATNINNTILESFDTPEMQYVSIDSVENVEDAVNYPVEFLNSLNPPGFPAHKITLKIGTPVILLRNFKPPKLCNGTRLRIKTLHRNVIEATIITGCGQGESTFIPRIPLISNDYPFNFKRLQFPLKLSFAITINKSQGQSLKLAGIDLRESCFSHGQFYVACSRVSSPKNLYILTPNGKTSNVVYKEVLR
ncbi:ATP-dependent DNA helicase pif1-like [Lucilia cuprina]|uniref:ATP-dependent DNA helicase pif1-like n=1 Tax=Lucilia cuprina TaxID=7375 RepID=UPI001F0655E7|nr:ATP-dependent DNA helicase pif1-like [Lucilia cuprina]